MIARFSSPSDTYPLIKAEAAAMHLARLVGLDVAQAMAIAPDGGRLSQFTTCLRAANHYDLSESEARSIIDDQIRIVTECWDEVADDVGLSGPERRGLWGNQVLNPFAAYGYATEFFGRLRESGYARVRPRPRQARSGTYRKWKQGQPALAVSTTSPTGTQVWLAPSNCLICIRWMGKPSPGPV